VGGRGGVGGGFSEVRGRIWAVGEYRSLVEGLGGLELGGVEGVSSECEGGGGRGGGGGRREVGA